MIGNWQISELSEPQRYFEYAKAYLQASIDVCFRMEKDENHRTWPNASVALMLATHSVELFLKGAILAKNQKPVWGHTLGELETTYRATYPDPKFAFECLFKTEYLGVSETEQAALKKKEPQPSILFRYPVKKPGVEWEGIHAFIPAEFLVILKKLNTNYTRLLNEFEGI